MKKAAIPIILTALSALLYMSYPLMGNTYISGSGLHLSAVRHTALPQHTPRININSADCATLSCLPGIGEGRANAIIKHRNQNGLFKNILEIQNVYGIGEKIYEEISLLICAE